MWNPKLSTIRVPLPTRRYFSPDRELFSGQEFEAYLQTKETADRFYADRWF